MSHKDKIISLSYKVSDKIISLSLSYRVSELELHHLKNGPMSYSVLLSMDSVGIIASLYSLYANAIASFNWPLIGTPREKKGSVENRRTPPIIDSFPIMIRGKKSGLILKKKKLFSQEDKVVFLKF